MKFKDYYQVMGLERDASQEEVKRAYRRLARKYHPDVSKEPDAEARFKEVGEAYEVLKDPEKRAAYDRFGKDWKAGQDFRPPPDWEPGFEFDGGGFTSSSEFSDFFESLFGRGGFERGRGGGGFRMRGQDQHARIDVTLEEAFNGSQRQLTLEGADASGARRQRTLNVRIPKGVTDGQRIRLSEQGGPGIGDAPPGDLYLVVHIQPHRLYRLEDRNVILDLPVTPWEAALGATIEVPTLGGKVDLKIPAGSQSGRKLRLKGRGLPGRVKGDQIVVLEIVTPEASSDEARSLYEEMARRMPMNPRERLGV
ncbi:MAG: DnaJ C-terminal domain-containing protein [Gammaproteobacteria bacterium]|nr:DnaJ C-terminal domain-containing protein [Gammaproteobacteria bacterium]